MPLLEGVGKPILAGNCQDENQKRKFMVRLWHRIAASLFLPQEAVTSFLLNPSCIIDGRWERKISHWGDGYDQKRAL
jgi:hypothetical protein